MRQDTEEPAPVCIKLLNSRYKWLDERLYLIDQLSAKMNQNHTSLEFRSPIAGLERVNETLVEWVQEESISGQPKSTSLSIRFKVLYFNNNQQFHCYIMAEPNRNADGVAIRKAITFKIYEVRDGMEHRVDAFTREEVQ